MDQRWNNEEWKAEVLDGLHPYHTVHHKSHMNCPGIAPDLRSEEPGPLPRLWHCHLVRSKKAKTKFNSVPQRKQRYSFTLSLTSALDGGWVVNATNRPLYPRETDTVSNVQETGCAPGPVWTGAENLVPTGIQTPVCPGHLELGS